MQPPRRRTPQFDLGSTEALRALILNATAALSTLLLLRIATLLVTDSDSLTIPRYIQLATVPLVWPLQQLPVASAELIQQVTVADLFLVPAVIFSGLLVAGVLSGWRDSDADSSKHPALPE